LTRNIKGQNVQYAKEKDGILVVMEVIVEHPPVVVDQDKKLKIFKK
jgi:hypothetical protein